MEQTTLAFRCIVVSCNSAASQGVCLFANGLHVTTPACIRFSLNFAFLRQRARLAMQDSNEDTQELSLTRNLRTQNVRRRLFVDETDTDRPEDRRGMADNQTNEFFEEVRSNLEKAKERWNFDFENETPLPGNYEWVKLDKDGNQIRDTMETTIETTAGTEDTKKITDSTVNGANSPKNQEIIQNDC